MILLAADPFAPMLTPTPFLHLPLHLSPIALLQTMSLATLDFLFSTELETTLEDTVNGVILSKTVKVPVSSKATFLVVISVALYNTSRNESKQKTLRVRLPGI